MNIIFFQNKVAKMFVSHSFFALFNFFLIFFSYYFLKPVDFSYLTGLFILEGLLIFFDLTIYNYVINKLSKLKNIYDKQKLICQKCYNDLMNLYHSEEYVKKQIQKLNTKRQKLENEINKYEMMIKNN